MYTQRKVVLVEAPASTKGAEHNGWKMQALKFMAHTNLEIVY